MSNQLVVAAAWDLVKTRARLWATGEMTDTEFHSSVMSYMDARKPTGGPKESKVAGEKRGAVLRFGKAKGKTMGEAEVDDLQWMLKVSLEGLENPDKQNFRASNERLINNLKRELKLRGIDAGAVTDGGGAKGGSVIRFGQAKGQTIGEASTENLQWLSKATQESLNDPNKQNYRVSNENLIAEIETELTRRGVETDPF